MVGRNREVATGIREIDLGEEQRLWPTACDRDLKKKFPANSLLIPCPLRIRLYPCGFRERNFFRGKKFPARFPAQGIWRRRLAAYHSAVSSAVLGAIESLIGGLQNCVGRAPIAVAGSCSDTYRDPYTLLSVRPGSLPLLPLFASFPPVVITHFEGSRLDFFP